MSGEEYIFEGNVYPARPDDFAFAKEFIGIAEKLWADGRWKAHPQRIEAGGLQGAVRGMQIMKDGQVSGEKLVYRVDETEWPDV